MIKNALLLIIVICYAPLFSQEVKQVGTDTKPEVFLVGTIHSMHFNTDYHYSINDLLSQIKALNPDIICGEITPEAFELEMEGYYPPEAAFLAQMSTQLNCRFVPVDWRLDYTTQSKAYREYPQSIKQQRSELLNAWILGMKASNCQSIYDFIHGEYGLHLIDSLYEKIIGINAIAEIAAGSWHERNRRIVENGLAAAGDAKRIVFVFGSDHLPQLRTQLKIMGIDAKIPKRMFVPNNFFEVSAEVIKRWSRNLEYLKQIRDKMIPSTYDNYHKVIDSKRIQDIELAIQKTSHH